MLDTGTTHVVIALVIGVYGAKALLQSVLFPLWFGGRASVFTSEFWFAMQPAMAVGFACSRPVNAVLIWMGVTERT